MTIIRAIALAALVAAAPAAAQQPQGGDRDVGSTAGEIATQPLEDLNIERDDIPPLLLEIRSPYEPLAEDSCAGIAREIARLDGVLGPDADVPTGEPDDLYEDVTGGAASVFAGLLLPFRSVIRRVTGAEAHERRLLQLNIRGIARRSYLKGLGRARGCEPPAAPYPYLPPAPPPPEADAEADAE